MPGSGSFCLVGQNIRIATNAEKMRCGVEPGHKFIYEPALKEPMA